MVIGADKFIDTQDSSRQKLHATQRYQRGYSDIDMWNADSFIADIIVAACNHYLDNAVSTPWNLRNDEWAMVLTEIRDGFEARDDSGAAAPPKRAWQLLELHFHSFWD